MIFLDHFVQIRLHWRVEFVPKSEHKSDVVEAEQVDDLPLDDIFGL